MPENIEAIEDSPNMFMDDRLNLQALKNKKILDSSLTFEQFNLLTKADLLKVLLKSTVLLHEGAEKIAEQRSQLTRYQMDQINRL